MSLLPSFGVTQCLRPYPHHDLPALIRISLPTKSGLLELHNNTKLAMDRLSALPYSRPMQAL
jgi:hypothetical protein